MNNDSFPLNWEDIRQDYGSWRKFRKYLLKLPKNCRKEGNLDDLIFIYFGEKYVHNQDNDSENDLRQ